MRRILASAAAVLAVSVLSASHAGSPPPRDSVRAEEIRPAPPEGWEFFQPPDGRFSIALPAHRVTSEAEDGGVTVHVVQARTRDDCQYAVLWSDGNGPNPAGTLADLLSSIAAGRGVSAENGSLTAGQDQRAGLPGRRLRGVSDKAEMDLRAYADGSRVYQLYAVCPRLMLRDTAGVEHSLFTFTEPERRAFFGSFDVDDEARSSR